MLMESALRICIVHTSYCYYSRTDTRDSISLLDALPYGADNESQLLLNRFTEDPLKVWREHEIKLMTQVLANFIETSILAGDDIEYVMLKGPIRGLQETRNEMQLMTSTSTSALNGSLVETHKYFIIIGQTY